MYIFHGKNKYSNNKNRANKYSQWEPSTQSKMGFGLCTVFLVTVAKYLINTFHFRSYFCQFLLPIDIFHYWLTFPISFTFAVCFGIYKFLHHLQGLKKNWEEVHKEFQSLSVFIDSIPKKIRKQRLEEEMKQLEHDIGVIEKHKIIYIANK